MPDLINRDPLTIIIAGGIVFIAFVALCAVGTLTPLLQPGAAPLAELFVPGDTLLLLFPTLLGAAVTVGLLSEQAHNRSQPEPDDHQPRP